MNHSTGHVQHERHTLSCAATLRQRFERISIKRVRTGRIVFARRDLDDDVLIDSFPSSIEESRFLSQLSHLPITILCTYGHLSWTRPVRLRTRL